MYVTKKRKDYVAESVHNTQKHRSPLALLMTLAELFTSTKAWFSTLMFTLGALLLWLKAWPEFFVSEELVSVSFFL
jgi:hypothetical protein